MKLKSGRSLTDSLLRLIDQLQLRINFTNIVKYLVKNEMDADVLRLAASDLVTGIRSKFIQLAFNTALRREHVSLAMHLWDCYRELIILQINDVCVSLITAFKRSPYLLEFKLFFF